MELMSIIYSSLLIFTILFLLTITISYASYKVKYKGKNRFSRKEIIPVTSGYKNITDKVISKKASYYTGTPAISAGAAGELAYNNTGAAYKPKRKHKKSINYNHEVKRRNYYKSGYVKPTRLQLNERIKVLNTTLFD